MKRTPPRRQLLFDFHTMPGNPDIGKNFDFEKIAGYFRECGVDSVMFPFRCNQGFAYFPTAAGRMYPGLERDLVGEMIKVCRKNGIQITLYTNACVSVEDARLHPEYLIRTPEKSAYDNTICANSGFTERICAMLREVTAKYNPDGIFLDFGYDPLFVCKNCTDKMTAEGIDWKNDPESHKRFSIRSSMGKYRSMCRSALENDPDILLCINGIPYEEKLDYSTHFEFECIPTGVWGYHLLPVYSHYLRNLGKPVTNMTGRFHGGWGDFGGIRPRASLEYDVFYGIANGMGITIGDHFHPRGDMYPPVMELVSGCMKKVRAVSEWIDGASPETEIVVVAAKGVMDGTDGNLDSVTGCARMLIELKQQFDIISDAMPLERVYKIMILPDGVRMTEILKKNIRRHLDSGGKIISSMYSGLECAKVRNRPVKHAEQSESQNTAQNRNASVPPELVDAGSLPFASDPECDVFAFDEWGIVFKGISPWNPSFIRAKGIHGFPDMPIGVMSRGSLVSLLPGTECAAEYIAPYFNMVSRDMRFFQYLPPKDPTGEAAMTFSEKTAHIAFPVFSNYFESGKLEYRKLVAHALSRFLPSPLVKAPAAPSFMKIFVMKQPGRHIIHMLSAFPEKRTPSLEVIEDDIEIPPMKIYLRTGTEKIKNVYTVPERVPVSFSVEGEYTVLESPPFRGHTAIVAERSQNKNGKDLE